MCTGLLQYVEFIIKAKFFIHFFSHHYQMRFGGRRYRSVQYVFFFLDSPIAMWMEYFPHDRWDGPVPNTILELEIQCQ